MAVTPEKIAVALGQTAPDPTSPTHAQWEMWIEDAEMLVQYRAESVGKAVGDLDQMKVDYVVREAVVAHVRRPDDATQVTYSVDDASTSKTYQSSKGRVVILDEWWQLLGLTETSGAFGIDMIPSTYSAHLPWCSLNFGAVYCSCGVDIAGVPIYELGS